MPSKRQILDALTRDELLDIVHDYQLEVADRRKKNLVLGARAFLRFRGRRRSGARVVVEIDKRREGVDVVAKFQRSLRFFECRGET